MMYLISSLPHFFRSFFDTPQAGIKAFGFATTAGEICNAIIMFCTPWIIHRIGAKKYPACCGGGIMTIRITGSAFATTATEVVILKMLHALEVPFFAGWGRSNILRQCLTPDCQRPFI